MNFKKVAFSILLFLIATVIAAYFIYQNKGGRLFPLFALIMVISAVSYYYGFISKQRYFLKFQTQAAFITSIFLLIFTAYQIRQDQEGGTELSKYIPPYPNIEETAVLPKTQPNQLLHMMLSTSDSKMAVERFYQNSANTPDWKVISVSDRTDNKTLRVILGNDVAVAAARNGKTNPWPEGAILGKVVWKQAAMEAWPTALEPKEFVHVEIMVKDEKKWSETGGWGYANISSASRPLKEGTCSIPLPKDGSPDYYGLL